MNTQDMMKMRSEGVPVSRGTTVSGDLFLGVANGSSNNHDRDDRVDVSRKSRLRALITGGYVRNDTGERRFIPSPFQSNMVQFAHVFRGAMLLISMTCVLGAQKMGTTSDGFEKLADLRDPAPGGLGDLRLVEALGPIKAPVFHLAAEAAGVSTTLSRVPRVGEHVRLWFIVRLHEGKVRFGFRCAEGIDVFPQVEIAPGEQALTILNGQSSQTGLSITGETWVNCALDYVVGADRMLLSVGKYQAPVSLAAGARPAAAGFFIAAMGDAVSVNLSGIEVYCVREDLVDALPVFGSIHWDLAEIPHVAPGPKGGISGHGLSAVDGQLYLIGGFIPRGDETTDDGFRTSRWVYRYSPATGMWSRLPDLPQRREYIDLAQASDGVIYCVGGGEQGKPRYKATASVFAFAPSGDGQWRALPPMPTPRTHVSSGVVGRKLVVVGGNEYDYDVKGYAPSTLRDTVEVLDLDRPDAGWVTGAPVLGGPMGWAGTVVAGGRLYVFGGFTFVPHGEDGLGKKSVRLQRTAVYDPEQDQWEQRAPAPYAVGGWRAALYRGRYAILIGGLWKSPKARSDRWNSEPLVYDTETDVWYCLRDSATPPGGVYNDPGLAVIGDTIYVTGAEATAAHYNYMLIGNITPLHP